MNEAVEAGKKNIKRILRKIVDGNREWHEKLSYALLGYHTIIRTSTPYMLVYGSETVIPAEVEIPSLRIIQEVGLDDAEWVRSMIEQLMLIDKKRLDAVCHGQLYQNRMIKAFNKKVKPRRFTPGQLVLKKIFPYQGEAKGKFSPNWQGPYIIHRVLSGEAVKLTEMDDTVHFEDPGQKLRKEDPHRKIRLFTCPNKTPPIGANHLNGSNNFANRRIIV
ncbi:uncharacterized protein LOC107849247 [Capsicum annuum]|uniref:uncharacterized protein LOC107849247 n=1 Tax=Capsicum annuum TaxID=4072 RepID=UPI001FB09446|nr:uncharacterized protein LOC107849247 [Capsicum annuum]